MKKSKGGKGSEVDMISNLPDPILHLILSRLPTTEEVIRTSILSTRWRHLWTSVSSIDVDYFRGLKAHGELRKNKFKEFVYRVLANNSLDLDSFRLCCANCYNMSIIGQWINTAVRRNVKLLDLMFYVEDEYESIELPHCLVTCASLEVLRLDLFGHRLSFPNFTGFPALRVLQLNSCNLLNDDLLKDILKSCPLLEDLILLNCQTCDDYYFCISCPKLKNLRIDNRDLDDFVLEVYEIEGLCYHLQICCPKLVCLEFAGFMAFKFTFESLDSLKKAVIQPHGSFEWSGEDVCELFAGISHVESLSLHICLIKKDINLEHLRGSLPNLKTLELTTKNGANNMDVLIQILSCSPNLESLQVIIEEEYLHSSSPAEAPNIDFLELKCTFKELKMVKVMGMSAVPHHRGFIEFLLESTPFLETMTITPCVHMSDGKSSFLTDVQRFPRASPEAKIIFLQDQV